MSTVGFELLKVGQRAIVESVEGCPDRFHELGLVPGTEVTVVRVAPFGDPVEVEVRGARLCLRRSEAKGLVLRLIG